MDAEALVLALLSALPRHEVRGRKRLQKLAYFAVNTGADVDAKFFLHDFGPFSTQVAAATDFLSFVGDLTEQDDNVGRTKKYLKVYRLAEPNSVVAQLPASTKAALQKLDSYTTVELEIASTILYFLLQGLEFDRAVDATKDLKPSKSEPTIVRRAERALAEAGFDEGRRAN